MVKKLAIPVISSVCVLLLSCGSRTGDSTGPVSSPVARVNVTLNKGAGALIIPPEVDARCTRMNVVVENLSDSSKVSKEFVYADRHGTISVPTGPSIVSMFANNDASFGLYYAESTFVLVAGDNNLTVPVRGVLVQPWFDSRLNLRMHVPSCWIVRDSAVPPTNMVAFKNPPPNLMPRVQVESAPDSVGDLKVDLQQRGAAAFPGMTWVTVPSDTVVNQKVVIRGTGRVDIGGQLVAMKFIAARNNGFRIFISLISLNQMLAENVADIAIEFQTIVSFIEFL